MSRCLLALGIASVLAMGAAWCPIHLPVLRVAGWIAGLVAGELAPQVALLQLAVAALLVARNGHRSRAGRVGLGLLLVSWIGLGAFYATGTQAAPAMERALREAFGSAWATRTQSDRQKDFPPSSMTRALQVIQRWHPDVELLTNISYGRVGAHELLLDIYRHPSRPPGSPVLMFLHGGGWVLGQKRGQGLPLMLHMARRGWTCVSASYRLSPAATFPDHLLDAKRALIWIREHAREYGADPGFVAVAGDSAGGHLAALVALTPNRAEYQPGHELIDTTVQACVPVYAPFDMGARIRPIPGYAFQYLVQELVMKSTPARSPEDFDRASPITEVGPHAPPFLVVQGEHDSLVPVDHAREFSVALRARSRSPVGLAVVPYAQHAFDLIPSLRTQEVVRGIAQFLEELRGRRR